MGNNNWFYHSSKLCCVLMHDRMKFSWRKWSTEWPVPPHQSAVRRDLEWHQEPLPTLPLGLQGRGQWTDTLCHRLYLLCLPLWRHCLWRTSWRKDSWANWHSRDNNCVMHRWASLCSHLWDPSHHHWSHRACPVVWWGTLSIQLRDAALSSLACLDRILDHHHCPHGCCPSGINTRQVLHQVHKGNIQCSCFTPLHLWGYQ